MVYLNSYSARFKSLGDSVVSLMVFGYLKPNDLMPIMEKGEAVSFLRVYHIGYLIVAVFAIVNFIIVVISDADQRVRLESANGNLCFRRVKTTVQRTSCNMYWP